jgi:PIN domain nuclease of toxin-antitoxin system
VRFLIDTHVFIWYIQNSERLPNLVTTLINDGNNQILLSIASIWEMAIKQSTGKLNLGLPYINFIEEQIRLNNIQLLPISLNHIEVITTLPFYHRDPFDRILIAQAITEDIGLVSVDSVFSLYPVQRIWE